MTTLTAGGETFRVQFRHQSKLTKRKTLHRAPMNVLTTCVIVADSGAKMIRGVAVGHSMCMPGDNFRKDHARNVSFMRAADSAMFKDVREELVAAYVAAGGAKPSKSNPLARVPRKALVSFLTDLADGVQGDASGLIRVAAEAIAALPVPTRVVMTEEERQKKIEAGAATRELRKTVEGRAQLSATKHELPQAAG